MLFTRPHEKIFDVATDHSDTHLNNVFTKINIILIINKHILTVRQNKSQVFSNLERNVSPFW